MTDRIFLSLLFVCLFFTGNLFSQQQTCPSLSTPPADNCVDACIFCDLNSGITSSTAGYAAGDASFSCGTLDNDQWFGFVAASSTATFTATPTSCTSGTGLQIGLYTSCNAAPLLCSPNDAPGNNALQASITATTLVPGNTYYIMIDGYAGAQCAFDLRVTPQGAATAPPLGPTGAISGPTSVCPGQTAVFSIPPVDKAGFYNWRVPTGWLVNGQPDAATVSGAAGTSVTVTVGSGSGQVCVMPGNSCNLGTPACLQVFGAPLAPTVLPDKHVCFEDLPFSWHGIVISAPDTMYQLETTFTTAAGCDSTVKQKLIVGDMIMTQLQDFNLQQGQCANVGGQDFCASGSFSVTLAAANGCDSIVKFTVNFAPPCTVAASITGGGTLTCAVTSVPLNCVPAPPTATCAWTLPGGGTASTNSINATAPGVYTVTVTQSPGCTATASATVLANLTPPTIVLAPGAGTLECPAGTDTLNASASMPAGGLTFAWSGPNVPPVSGNGPILVATIAGNYIVTVTNPANGCSAVSTISVAAGQGLPTADAGDDKFITCKSDTTLLDGTGSSGPVGFTVTWTGPAVVAGDQNRRKPRVHLPGIYTLVVEDKLTKCKATDYVSVDYDRVPPVASAGPNQVLTCTTSVVQLNSSATTPPDYKALWSGPGIDKANRNAKNPNVFLPGTYTVTVTKLSNFCTATATTQVTKSPNLPVASAGPDQTLPAPPDSAQLDGSGSTGSSLVYFWSGPGITPATRSLVKPKVGVAGNYTLRVTDAAGCVARDRAIVLPPNKPAPQAGAANERDELDVENASETVFVPGLFAPENSGALMLRASDDVWVKNFRIVDQLGRTMFFAKNFAANDPANAWDGLFDNGSAAPAGVYFWSAEIETGGGEAAQTVSGKVMLLRN